MELVAINLARAVAILEIQSFDPKGAHTDPENFATLAEGYKFAKIPQTLEELNTKNGVTFGDGRFEDIAISQIQIFPNGVVIDTRSSTNDSLRILDDLLSLAKSRNGATFSPTRRHFVSQISFRSDLKLSFLNPMLQRIANELTEVTSRDLAHPITFEPTAVLIGPDSSQLKIPPNAFTLERRAETSFSE